jgi:hypothetical protein
MNNQTRDVSKGSKCNMLVQTRTVDIAPAIVTDDDCETCSTQTIDEIHATLDVNYGYGHPYSEKYGYARSRNFENVSSNEFKIVSDWILLFFVVIF